MPIVEFHLVAGQQPDGAIRALLEDASRFYAETFYPETTPPPVDRVRAFVTLHAPDHWATGGRLVAEGGGHAPWFRCLALAGRPAEQLEALMRGMTDRVARHCGCARGLVRGQLVPVDPAHWSIAGEPASRLRADEIRHRAADG